MSLECANFRTAESSLRSEWCRFDQVAVRAGWEKADKQGKAVKIRQKFSLMKRLGKNNDSVIDMTAEEGSSSVSQLAKKVQGASAKGWKCMSSLFNKDDEHKLLPAENIAPVEHVLSEPAPQEPGPEKKLTGFWDSFATKWHQTSEANKGGDSTGAGAGEGEAVNTPNNQDGETEDMPKSGAYTNLGESSDPGFKWNFVTSKLAELKNRSMQKSN
ncbi:uncharacterized protein C1orf232 isoform X2 [Scyliorhinus canicula]|uniref:uncharacterized protein C1orf232 isoform X2 n=1 Tax=Scyliorhinus canicula TaxID=7830 RepID=UPI0018F751B5|nr:uncharacterized protein C1orf232 isoform X2 [Scyliorhinus canicula]